MACGDSEFLGGASSRWGADAIFGAEGPDFARLLCSAYDECRGAAWLGRAKLAEFLHGVRVRETGWLGQRWHDEWNLDCGPAIPSPALWGNVRGKLLSSTGLGPISTQKCPRTLAQERAVLAALRGMGRDHGLRGARNRAPSSCRRHERDDVSREAAQAIEAIEAPAER